LVQFVGCYAQIYNGKGFVGLKITEEMVSHKFGEFAFT
jgi:small subunit ribosomal protein S19